MSGLPRAQGHHRWHQLVKAIEPFDGAFDYMHQLAALFFSVTCEQLFKFGLELEQAAKEQSRSYIADWFHLLEADLHQVFLFPCHWSISSFSRLLAAQPNSRRSYRDRQGQSPPTQVVDL
jgi:hypothetical protein